MATKEDWVKLAEDFETVIYEELPTHEWFGFRCSESQMDRADWLTDVFPKLCNGGQTLH